YELIPGLGKTVVNPTYNEIRRPFFVFDLSSIEDSASVTAVELTYSTVGGSGTFSITHVEELLYFEAEQDPETDWHSIGDGTLLESGLSFGNDNFYSNSIKTLISNALNNDETEITLGAYSSGTIATLEISLKVEYTIPAPKIDLMIQNDLNSSGGGNIGVGIYPANPLSKSSPCNFKVRIKNKLNLEAYDKQSVNDYTWYFDDGEIEGTDSYWDKEKGLNITTLGSNQSITTEALTTDDDGATINAYLKIGYTMSGSMLSNETWSDLMDVTLDDTLKVPSGVTLSINSNATVDLNGYSIVSTGGTIILDDNADISSDIRLMSGSSIAGLYPTLASAFDAGSTVEARSDISLNGYTVPENKTLTVLDGATIRSASGKYFDVSGTLNVDNANFTNSSGTWGGLRFQSGSSGRLQNINISNAAYGMYFNSASTDSTDPSIHVGQSFIQNCSNYGIYVYNSSPEIDSCWVYDEPVYVNNGHPHIEQCLFDDQVSMGYSMTIYSSIPTFYRNEIISTDAQLTMEVTNGSVVYFGNTPPGLNYLEASEYADGVIWALSGSQVYLGNTDNETPPAPYHGTQNSIIGGQGTSPAYADGTSNIYAELCWWGQTPPPDCYGNVDYTPYLSTPPSNVGSSFYKSISTPIDFKTFEDTSWTKARSMLAIANGKIKEGDYAFAREYFSMVIERYPSSPQAYIALNSGVSLCCKYKGKDVIEFVDELLEKVQDKTLKAAIKSKKVSQLRHLQRIDEAIIVSEQMLKENTDTEYELYALFDLFNYYHKDLDKPELAAEYLAQLKDKYPDNNLTLIARTDVGEDISDIMLTKKALNEESEPELTNAIPETYEMYEAFPNPFNPNTTIEFALPVQSEVNCSIYNVRGVLVKEYRYEQNAGTHQIVWNASNVSSGIYLIRFVAEASDGSETFIDYQKVTLLK
ncbi:MAG: T9SS type A sorting domain-containing protein, partial [bacterium]|nr:T9SS type A sorting domain-containing protein [bacterium]